MFLILRDCQEKLQSQTALRQIMLALSAKKPYTVDVMLHWRVFRPQAGGQGDMAKFVQLDGLKEFIGEIYRETALEPSEDTYHAGSVQARQCNYEFLQFFR